MKKLTLSIVIPVYNEEDHIQACLESIASQEQMPEEVIVVDNNSTDKTSDIAKKFPFVRLIKASKQGVVYARNTGFDAVRSDIIGRIDADTVLPADWTLQVKKAFKSKHVSAVTGPVFYYDMPLSGHNHHIDHMFRKMMSKKMDKFPFLYGSNAALRAEAWRAVREHTCTERHIHEDLDLAIHLQDAGYNTVYLPEMRGGVSARRYDDDLDDFARYMKMFISTYQFHDRPGIMPYIAVSAYTMGYFALQPVRWTYDAQSKKHSLKHILKTKTPRKNPNAV